MCGRFVTTTPPEELARYFDAEPPADPTFGPDYNVAPGRDVMVVRDTEDRTRLLESLHWGLVPFWAKDPSVGNRMINARSETLATKASFKAAFSRRRCIVPADGFYEWRKLPDGRRKQPYFIHSTDGNPLAFAGIWEQWKSTSPDGGGIRSTTIITTVANDTIAAVHDRMPVLLDPSSWDRWLDPAVTDTAALQSLLVPAPVGVLALHPVDPAVGNVRNHGPHLIDPLVEPASLDLGPATP